ncbi:neuralized domain-containing protein [Phthorimaea operculella]|nr:neuralized domain-containing protein [Phthorimaea operculella]
MGRFCWRIDNEGAPTGAQVKHWRYSYDSKTKVVQPDGTLLLAERHRRLGVPDVNHQFRIDKVAGEWSGSVSIGALGSLPAEPMPQCAMHLDPPVWLISSDLLHDNGTFKKTQMASVLDELVEQSVLTIHFRFNSDLVVDVDGKVVGVLGTVPRSFSHVFPVIDLYGKVHQVSVLLHPHVVISGTSLDLPIITENLREESLAELELDDSDDPIEPKRKAKAYSQDNLVENHQVDLIAVQPGPSNAAPLPSCLPSDNETINKEIKFRKVLPQPNRASMHQSLILPHTVIPVDNNEMVNRCIQKSHSTHNFGLVADDTTLESEIKETLRHTFSVGSRVGDDSDEIVMHDLCDTNIRHNDRYPEANDVDNLDNEIMDALTLETGNLPDLTEEQSSSIDESTRRDEFWSETLSVENLNYLNRILCLDQDGTEVNSLESEWEASGEGCEHLHLVLKYWNFLVLPYPELRQAVSWGQVRCYCNNCQPDSPPHLSGWVRIERIDGVGACRRAFWHVARHTLGSAQSQTGPVRRPRSLAPTPCVSPPLADIWFDEEGKPHHTVLAIEIDVEGSDADNDRLLAFLIYLKSHVVFVEDNPPSLDE